MDAQPLAELLKEHFKYRTMESVSLSSPKPEAFKRRVYDIVHGRQAKVSLRVADEIAITCGHPEWIALLDG